ncbi:thioredoxin domain-containing protein [Candidatus Dojkabacteria bacterium]|uniref:Thioredoxin domain-containing protein n=1 Tax=Candidatus Dojkabacteria bacterium TaxID=2099670 RepID=A0A955RMD2_9BACT|nr:thioredoxin domain-containing protein [Candidatus Dojkabacteria bacterium]
MEKNSSLYFIIGALVLGLGFLGFLAFAQKGQPTSFERDLINIAEGIGLDGEKFFEDYKSDKVKNKVQDQIDYGNSIGVNATPSAFINEEPIEISATYEEFRGVMQSQIDNADELPITFSVFEDYQCPFCANFFPIPYLVKAEFGEDVIVEHYNYPLDNIHPLARRYAYAVIAAEEQGKYYEMSRAIFEFEHDKEYPELDLLIEGSEPVDNSTEEQAPVENTSE